MKPTRREFSPSARALIAALDTDERYVPRAVFSALLAVHAARVASADTVDTLRRKEIALARAVVVAGDAVPRGVRALAVRALADPTDSLTIPADA